MNNTKTAIVVSFYCYSITEMPELSFAFIATMNFESTSRDRDLRQLPTKYKTRKHILVTDTFIIFL